MSRADAAAALGTAPIGRLLWRNSVQTTLSVATYGVYALTNAFFVSRWVGPAALASVNVAAPLLMLIGAVATTVGAGGASVLSRALGAGDLTRAARATGTSLGAYWLLSAALGVLGIVFLDPLVRLLGATPEVAQDAKSYALILLAGSITATGFSSLVRAEGRMGFSTLEWMIPVVTQIVLDPVFIIGFHLGVRGAALGTVGGQLVSAAMGFWFFLLQRRRLYRVSLRHLIPDPALLREIAAVGAPTFVAGLGVTVLSVVTNNLLAVTGGALALSAYAIAARIGTFVGMPQLGITQAMQPIVGYNYGAGRSDRAHRAASLSLRVSVLYGAGAALVVALAARLIAGTFTTDAATADAAATALRMIALAYPFGGLVGLTAAWYQSRGFARPSFILSVGTVMVVKLPVLLAFSLLGIPGIWWAFPVGEALSALAAWWLWRRPIGTSPTAAPV
jgi:putative MATE family efflux protein